MVVTGAYVEEIKRAKRFGELIPAVKTSIETFLLSSCRHGNKTESLDVHECFDAQVVVKVINDSPHPCRLLVEGGDIALSSGVSAAVHVSDATGISAWKWLLPGTKRTGSVLLPHAIKEAINILLKQAHVRQRCRGVLDSIEVQVSAGEWTDPVATRSPLTLSVSLKRLSVENGVSARIRLCLVVTDSYGCDAVGVFRSGRWNVEFDLPSGSSVVHKAVVGFTLPGIYQVHCAMCVTDESESEAVWRYKGCTTIRSMAAAVTP